MNLYKHGYFLVYFRVSSESGRLLPDEYPYSTKINLSNYGSALISLKEKETLFQAIFVLSDFMF